MNFSNIAATAAGTGLSFADRGIKAAQVVLTGFVVVFAMLLLLIFIIKIYGSIIMKVQQSGKKKKDKAAMKQHFEHPAAVSKSAPVIAEQTAGDEGIDGEIIAVISAAVASMYDSPEKVRIKSVKKSGAVRSAWSNAGLLDNTRPF